MCGQLAHTMDDEQLILGDYMLGLVEHLHNIRCKKTGEVERGLK